MLAPISWLKDFVDIKVSPETLAKKLVAIGFEVEDIIYQAKQATKVVVGRITAVERHPNADRLRVAAIDAGGVTLQVVTNAAVAAGETVAVARDGARLYGGQTIVRGELRGVLSEGMLCGLEELGLSADEAEGQSPDDIIRFPEGTPIGGNALSALGHDEVVLDVAVTANRPDCNSIYKLAREVAVALKTECREPKTEYTASAGKIGDMVAVEVLNPELCPRYMAGGVVNVRIFPSPALIRKRLRAVGIRPINNIVDITNYVLIEIGQPMHAFDLRDLTGRRIVVRTAADGEKITTLDGKENTLNHNMLVICDSDRPVAVAGVMGGENSGIKADTSDIVFESAKFARDSVRRTSRALNLRSDSSARYEKGIDFASQELGLKRALTLICETGSGDVVEGVVDVCADYPKNREIEFTTAQLEKILGCKAPKAAVKSILTRLGIGIRESGRTLIASVPDARDDVSGVNDIAEEFIRVYGYSHVKPTLFEYSPLTKGGKPEGMVFVDKIKTELAALGLDECVTYSFTSPRFADMLRLPQDSPLRNTIGLLNPLGEGLSVMRTTLVHSMLETLARNISRFNKSAALFEIANVYIADSLPLAELPEERAALTMGMYGGGCDFFEIKGVLDGLFSALGLRARYEKSQRPFLHPGRGAEVLIDGVCAGFVGELHPDSAEAYGIDCRVYVAELSLEILRGRYVKVRPFKTFSKFPPASRDLAVVVDEELPAGRLLDAVLGSKIRHLAKAEIFDSYRGAQIGPGKKSVALAFEFSSEERTLTDEEINVEMRRILSALKRKAGARIRL